MLEHAPVAPKCKQEKVFLHKQVDFCFFLGMFQGYVEDFFSEGIAQKWRKKGPLLGAIFIIAESAGARKGLQQDCQLIGLKETDGHTFGQGLRPETRKGRKTHP